MKNLHLVKNDLKPETWYLIWIEDHLGYMPLGPKFKKGNDMACHEWFIEFTQENPDIQTFQTTIDLALQKQNKYSNSH